MLFWLDSKTYLSKFLANEDVSDILFSQYALLSTKIQQIVDLENILTLTKLYPNSKIMILQGEEMQLQYVNQLKNRESIATIIALIDASFKTNVFIMTTHSEEKETHCCEILANFVEKEFGYPIYSYEDFHNGKITISQDTARDLKVKKKIDKLQQKLEEDSLDESLNTREGRLRFEKSVKRKTVSKKYLEKILKKEGLYEDGMSRNEMLETIQTFM